MVFVGQDAPPKSLIDPSLYAPALPAVVVALFVLFAGDRLTRRRERRKEVRELCEDLNDRALEAVESAIRAWTESKKSTRTTIVLETRRRFKTVGVTATDLQRLTGRRKYLRTLWLPWNDRQEAWQQRRMIIARDSLDVSVEVVALRRTSMQDPFDEPNREATSRHLPAVNDALANLTAAVSREFQRLYR